MAISFCSRDFRESTFAINSFLIPWLRKMCCSALDLLKPSAL